MIHEKDIVLITGAGGMLGEAVYQRFNDRCIVHATDININEPWLERLDVTSKKDIGRFFARVKPNFIIHLAALTDMEYCEMYPHHAFDVNAAGVANMADIAHGYNIPLVYISTAGVFDGKKEAYTEEDDPNPISIYAKAKYEGERIARSLNKSIVIRAGWMMGGGPRKDKKFINKIIKQLRAGAKEIAVVSDKHGTPCYTYDLAKIIEYLLDGPFYGLYHGVCEGGGSRYDVAKFLVSSLGKNNEVKLTEVDSNHFKESYFAPRPPSEKLINIKLKAVGANITRDWRECLSEYLTKFNWNLWDLNTSGMERSFYKNYFTIEKNHWLMIVRRSIVLDLIKLYSNKSPQEMKILDFGCGSGYFVSKLRDAGYQVQGLDISAEAIQYGQRQGIRDIDVLDAHRFNFSDRCFDCVLSLDVIEHLEDESWALQEFERILKPGGILIMTVPAFTFLWGVQDKAAHHFRRYSMSQLLKKVRSSTRLSILKTSYFNFFLFLPIAAFRLTSRLFNTRNRESDFEINNELLNKVLLKTVDFERLILKYINFPVGVSILLVLQKSDSARGITGRIESMAHEPRDSGDLKEEPEIHALRP